MRNFPQAAPAAPARRNCVASYNLRAGAVGRRGWSPRVLHIPILRHGRPYRSADVTTLVHHATGEPLAELSLANSGLIVRDIRRMSARVLERFRVRDLVETCRRAADIFLTGDVPIGIAQAAPSGESPARLAQSFEEYVRLLSATTGMPITYCRNNARKIHKVLSEMDGVLAGLTRGLDPDILDRGYGETDGRITSFFRAGRVLGGVLPSNSPGVHSLWIPAVAMKAPIVLKPGREEPWTPLRIIESLAAAGIPREAFGYYPTDHAGASAILQNADRAMLFGDASTTRPWQDDPRIELHGPGYSKLLLGEDAAAEWPKHIDLMASSICANAGRSCINASAVWTPKHGREIAAALGAKLAAVRALPVDDPGAEIAAFANPKVAEAISATIDQGLREAGAEDVTLRLRGSERLVRLGRVAYLLPTVVWCGRVSHDVLGGVALHPLANREFLFPYAAVVECPVEQMADAIGPTLIVSAVTRDERLISALMSSPNVDRLNIGPIPTWEISWDQPHEGNLFELLYRQRAFQQAAIPAAT